MPDPQSVRFALLGTGVVADFHHQAIEANADVGAELTAVAHYDAAQFGKLEARFGVPCFTEEALLDRDDVDAVILCTPSGQHAEQAVRAAQVGKHVLVEKPMALSLADADRMIEACEAADVRLGVVFQRRAVSPFRKVRTVIEQGELGRLTLGLITLPYVRDAAYYASADWRGTWALDGGGVLMNQGIHLVDLLVWFLGDPEQVEAHAATLQHQIEVEDTLAATLKLRSGALATITATTTAAPGFPHRIEVYGTEGGIQIEGEAITRWTSADGTEKAQASGAKSGAGSGGDPRGIALEGHIGILRDFVEAIRDGRPPLVDGREGRRSLAAVQAIYEAAGLVSTESVD